MNPSPHCVIVTGRPGSGKTTLAHVLAREMWMPVISRDEIKEGLVNTLGRSHDQLPAETNAAASSFFFEIVFQYLANRVSIIIEAAFQHHVWAPRVPRLQELARPFFVICTIDDGLAADRHLQRGLAEPKRGYFHGDPRVSKFKKTGQIAPPGPYAAPNFSVPTLRVSTEKDYVPAVAEIAGRILGKE